MPSASVATTSPEIGPSIVLQISTRISSGSPCSLASRVGLVVMPSTTPSVAASRISARLAVSRKIFMVPASAAAGVRPPGPHRDDIPAAGCSRHGRLERGGGSAFVAGAVERGDGVPIGDARLGGGVGPPGPPGVELRDGRARLSGRLAVDAVAREILLWRRRPDELKPSLAL